MKKLDTFFSVVIPFFNRETYLLKAIQSVLDQSYPHWELILVNDGSTDQSLELAQSVQNPRVRVISYPQNQGNAYARNRGWESAKYDWVAYLDSDDWYQKDYLKKLCSTISENPLVSFFWTGVRFVTEDGKIGKEECWKPLNSLPSDTFFDRLGIGTNAGVCFSRDILLKEKGFNEGFKAAVDREFFLRISTRYQGKGIDYIGINCLLGSHESVRKNYKNQADAYTKLITMHEKLISLSPKRKMWWYHKAMWLSLYAENKREAFWFLRKGSFKPKSCLVFLVFLILPTEAGMKFHKRLAS